MQAASGTLYCGPAPLPEEIWTSWNFDLPLLLALMLLALIIGRKVPGAAAVAVLFIAFVSPLCALSAALFSARVVHHVLLVVVAAPLIALALRPGRAVIGLMPAFVVSTAALWLWHLPAAYDAAMANVGVYWGMQATLLLSAILFWRAVLQPGQPLVRVITYIWAALMQMALLGALLTFAPGSLYAIHATAPMYWGLTALEDQQLGGLIMWVPASIPYVIIGALIARRSWTATQGRTT
jgi:putative membrane protein